MTRAMPSEPDQSSSDQPATDIEPFDQLDGMEDGDELAEAESGIDLGFDEEAAPASVRIGAAVIRRFWRTLPMGPGVYRMLGTDGEVLYVGKARSLKKRVASYTRATGHTSRISRMIASTASMVVVSTATETEALLLEANYIKQMRPRFNVLMRDDKSFPYILITGDHRAPQLVKHRGARNRKGHYFGPFASVSAVNRTLNALQRAFLLRSCTDSYFENRTRPCLLFQIKRCSGPCTDEVSHGDYGELVEEARGFLSGRSGLVRNRLAEEMVAAAEQLEFERAARLRDRISSLSAIQGSQGVNPKSVEEADVFAIIDQAGQFAVEVFFFRTYQNWGNKAFFPRADKSFGIGEVLDSFLVQFYLDKPPPRLILLSHDIEDREVLEQLLTERAGYRVEIAVPQRGEKRELVEQALHNGREALVRRLSETASQEKLLAGLASAFGVPRPLRRVEVYDNSHIMGTNAIGAMVVAGPEGFLKNQYRTFNIKDQTLTPGDDFGMMREVLGRRFQRLVRERKTAEGSVGDESVSSSRPDPDDVSPWPDLILIDGGKGQLEAVRAALSEIGVPQVFGPDPDPSGVAVVGIAKGPDRNAGRETFFIAGRDAFKLPERDAALYFVQRLRDEAHRFAIGTHRARRKKDLVRNPLDEIGGVGPARKRALLHAFGTAKAIGRASLDDLARVPGVNAATAQRIYDFFHEKR